VANRIAELWLAVLAMVMQPGLAMADEVSRPEIWLAPFAPYTAPDDIRKGAPDYFELFKPVSAWAFTASHVKVFKIYRDQVVLMPDAALETIFRGLAERKIALAMETNILLETSVCAPGIDKAKPITPVLERMKRLGADLRYLALNEPLAGGHFAYGPNDCRASIEAVAADVAASLRPLYAVYPDLQVGDIEPIGRIGDMHDWPDEIAKWMDAFRAATGKPFAFMHADTVWGRPWQEDLRGFGQVTRVAGIPFGVIYNGDFTELSDAAWAGNTARYASQVEDGLGIRPDQVIFQSWSNWPQHSVPDSDLTTMTGMVRDYLRERSILTAGSGNRVRLVDEHGAPIAHAPIAVQVQETVADAPFVPQKIEGVVPPDAVAALVAGRLNAECLCPRAAMNIDVKNFVYGEKDARGGYEQAQFSWNFGEWAARAPAAVRRATAGDHAALNISIGPKDSQVLDGPRFPVHAGAEFQARFDWRVSRSSEGAGNIVLIFFGANGIETRRTDHRLVPTWRTVKTLTSDAGGFVDIPADHFGRSGDRFVQLSYAGDENSRPVALELDDPRAAR
jgi:hypothetical protein